MNATHDITSIEGLMRGRGWKREVNPLGEIEYTDPQTEWQVQVSPDGWWSLRKFTDSDVPDERYKGGFVALGRFESIDEGDGAELLEAAMVANGVIPWSCPYCGEEGGTPVTVGWREYQGVSPHGGMVDFTEERCTRCAK